MPTPIIRPEEIMVTPAAGERVSMNDSFTGESWPATWPKRVGVTDMKEINRETKPFVEFYKDIATGIENHIVNKVHSSGKADFIRFLCCGFWWEYEEWRHAPVASFLQRAHGRAIKALGVACQAYFHMAYDLPRVIADALTANPPISLDVFTARDTFYEMDYLFEPVLKAQFRNPKSVGFFARVAKLVPGDSFSLHGIAAVWVLAIRARSFHHGEILTRAQAISRSDRDKIEAELQRVVIVTMDETLKHKLNPASWFSILKSPSIRCISFPTLLFCIASLLGTDAWSHVGLPWKIAIGAGASAGTYILSAYVGLLRLVARIGSQVADATERVMQDASLLYPVKTVE